VAYFLLLQGYIWDANCSSYHISLLHFVGTLKQIFEDLKERKKTNFSGLGSYIYITTPF